MADRPILFSAPMVRALLDGRKTQTRRIMKVQPPEWATYCEQPEMLNALGKWVPSGLWRWSEPEQTPLRALRQWPVDGDGEHYWMRLPFAPGDRLWVKETWRTAVAYDDLKPSDLGGEEPVKYGADGEDQMWGYPHLFLPGKTRVSIFMPRWASRLTLVVSDVRVERLHAISEMDAQAEGAERLVMDDSGTFYSGHPEGTYRCGFAGIWSHINGPDSWDANPWVVAASFTVERRNIDQ